MGILTWYQDRPYSISRDCLTSEHVRGERREWFGIKLGSNLLLTSSNVTTITRLIMNEEQWAGIYTPMPMTIDFCTVSLTLFPLISRQKFYIWYISSSKSYYLFFVFCRGLVHLQTLEENVFKFVYFVFLHAHPNNYLCKPSRQTQQQKHHWVDGIGSWEAEIMCCSSAGHK